jgi:hypothetical protein
MPSPFPERERNVYFVGAGLSCAFGLPNTAMLLDGVLALTEKSPSRMGDLATRLERAFKFFYPEAVHDGYRPDVVDFFSSLRTYLDVGAGLPGGFADAPQLYRSLKRAIVELLLAGTLKAEPEIGPGHPWLDELIRPGNIVITSNWDVLIERCAYLREVPVRLLGTGGDNELTLLKLHGSLDWCLGRHMRRLLTSNTKGYATLNECLFPQRRYRPKLPPRNSRADLVLRIRALERWSRAPTQIRVRATEPHMVTMARGKSGDLGPLREIWRDAYGALSRARRLEIVGYSMPSDDIEIRTLLRAGVQRGARLDEVLVRNPAPEVHVRIRQYLDRSIKSDYRGVQA